MQSSVDPTVKYQLNTKALLVGLIVAIVAASLLTVAYIVPKWETKPKPPRPTSHACSRDLDCDERLTCIEGYCTLVDPPTPFPTTEVVTVSGFIIIAILVVSILLARQTEHKKTIAIVSVTLILGLIVLAVAFYYTWVAEHVRQCPEQPKESCPEGYTSTCGESTNWGWKCEKQESYCPEPRKVCPGDAAPQCNPNNFQWECPSGSCSDTPITCKGTDTYDMKARCDDGTSYNWECEKTCLKTAPASLTCPKGYDQTCDADHNHEWTCIQPIHPVCDGPKPPGCESEAECVENVGVGYEWQCPAQMTRAELIRNFSLTQKSLVNYDTKKHVVIYFIGTDFKVPVAPTLNTGMPENPSHTLGPDYNNIIGNPKGNLVQTASGPVFVPYNPKIRLYYQVSPKSTYQGIVTTQTDFIEHVNVGNVIPANLGPYTTSLAEAMVKCKANKKCTGIFQDKRGTQYYLRTGAIDKKAFKKGPYTFHVKDPVPASEFNYPKVNRMDLHYVCENGGLFKQDRPNVTEPEQKADGTIVGGSCACATGWTGNVCQYSDATTCSNQGHAQMNGACKCFNAHYNGVACELTRKKTCNDHGNPKADGTCACDVSGWNGPQCQWSNENRCNDRGLTGPDVNGVCATCKDGYIGHQCQAPPAKSFGCEKFWTGPGHSSASSQIENKCRRMGFDHRLKDHDCGRACWACQYHKYTCYNTPNVIGSKYPNKDFPTCNRECGAPKQCGKSCSPCECV